MQTWGFHRSCKINNNHDLQNRYWNFTRGKLPPDICAVARAMLSLDLMSVSKQSVREGWGPHSCLNRSHVVQREICMCAVRELACGGVLILHAAPARQLLVLATTPDSAVDRPRHSSARPIYPTLGPHLPPSIIELLPWTWTGTPVQIDILSRDRFSLWGENGVQKLVA